MEYFKTIEGYVPMYVLVFAATGILVYVMWLLEKIRNHLRGIHFMMMTDSDRKYGLKDN